MNLLIIEDEHAAAQRLRKLIQTTAPEARIVHEIDSVERAVRYFREKPSIDLVLMDIQLADGECFDIFEETEVDYPVIFTTAYDEYAIRAFKVNSIDYLLKPVKEEDLAGAFEKWKRIKGTMPLPDYGRLATAVAGREKLYKKRFLLRMGHNIISLLTEDIAYFYSEAKSTFLVTLKGKTYTVDESLDRLEDLIDPTLFFRINRKYLINFYAIDQMLAYSKARVLLKLNPPVRSGDVVVSTERSPHFKKWLDDER